MKTERQQYLERAPYDGMDMLGSGIVTEPELGDAPDLDTLMEYMDEGGCEATDGCWVEPDGTCPHGKPSWLIALGMI